MHEEQETVKNKETKRGKGKCIGSVIGVMKNQDILVETAAESAQ